MRSLRRLSVVSIAPLSAMLFMCAANVRAQTAPAPPAPGPAPFAAPVPPLFLPPLFPVGPPQVQALPLRVPPLSPSTIHRLETAPNAEQARLITQMDGPCYALRTYGFTVGHDPAEAPRLTSHSTCTPASKSHIRELVNGPSSANH